jgi:hypothetical protein
MRISLTAAFFVEDFLHIWMEYILQESAIEVKDFIPNKKALISKGFFGR